jgi:hypothetical protein
MSINSVSNSTISSDQLNKIFASFKKVTDQKIAEVKENIAKDPDAYFVPESAVSRVKGDELLANAGLQPAPGMWYDGGGNVPSSPNVVNTITAADYTLDSPAQDEALRTMYLHDNINKSIQGFMDNYGFAIPEGATLSIKVLSAPPDGMPTFQVTGTGDDAEDAMITKYLNHDGHGQAIIEDIQMVNDYNNVPQTKLQTEKFMAGNMVKMYGGTHDKLADLSLQDGQIVGATGELAGMINAKTPEEMMKVMEPDKPYDAYTAKMLWGDAQNEISQLKDVLAAGPDTIPDISGTVQYRDGSLYETNVKYGFGSDQFASWYPTLANIKVSVGGNVDETPVQESKNISYEQASIDLRNAPVVPLNSAQQSGGSTNASSQSLRAQLAYMAIEAFVSNSGNSGTSNLFTNLFSKA